MQLQHLRLENLRVFERLELDLSAGWNLLLGPNGAGKTSVLEAIFLLSHGRSFRSGGRDALARHGSEAYAIFGELCTDAGSVRRVGLARNGNRTSVRIDGQASGLGELVRHCAVVCLEPGSHELIAGPSEGRRRYLDWGVFHVEPEFLGQWRRYQRALKQRNSLLREGSNRAAALEPWEHEMADAGERVTALRRDYAAALRPLLAAALHGSVEELGVAELVFVPGYDTEQGLAHALAAARPRDAERGTSTRGPHRADWSLRFQHAPRHEHLSRGQEKLGAFACLLAQAELYALQRGAWPIMCVDDLASELDARHQGHVIDRLQATGAQVLVTGTDAPRELDRVADLTRFHVEHGRIERLL